MGTRKSNHFNIMIAGSIGTGKSSFINTLFSNNIINIKNKNSTEINIYTVDIPNNKSNKKSRVNITLIPSFGTYLDDTIIHESAVHYIKNQYEKYLEEEKKIRRNPDYNDMRVDLLLYFLKPRVKGALSSDIHFLKKVNNLVNIIPIVGKSDALTEKEYLQMRKAFNEQIKANQIKLFELRNKAELDTINIFRHFKRKDAQFKTIYPLKNINLSWIGSCNNRSYGESKINYIDERYSEFLFIKELLLSNFNNNFIEDTHYYIYEDYRAEILSKELSKNV